MGCLRNSISVAADQSASQMAASLGRWKIVDRDVIACLFGLVMAWRRLPARMAGPVQVNNLRVIFET